MDKDETISQSNWDAYDSLMDTTVRNFMEKLDEGIYHPNTYVFYGKEVKSDGFLT
ncbi:MULTISPECIES: hypothetical protein [Providencia]|uniref:hypothetical protein n=1 Tax=Providencia TaxID=586 RepID=UPI00131418C6|nr:MULTISPECIES: hypothetical protein [Providencia]EKH6497968.1 hypothetical protein [Providencia rettgeri]ELR5154873.1 hypothetical protein [Providencia rettgeri]ELR5181931.1 hypothetical protein [Providencia rettgeri]ELR5266439.1 hypothetical protein [Providencia rettgeri]